MENVRKRTSPNDLTEHDFMNEPLVSPQAPAPNAIFSEVGLGTGVGATGTASAGVAGVVGLLALAAQGLLRRGTSEAVRFQRFHRSDSLCSFLVRERAPAVEPCGAEREITSFSLKWRLVLRQCLQTSTVHGASFRLRVSSGTLQDPDVVNALKEAPGIWLSDFSWKWHTFAA